MNDAPPSTKSVNLYLMDGVPNGRVECKLGDWMGVAYRIPRVRLPECKDMPRLDQSGVYFLFGRDDDDEPFVYVGQANVILKRWAQHHANPKEGWKDWTEAIAFTDTSGDWMSATEISWLENYFYNLAKSTGRCVVKNGNEPNKPPVGQAKESEIMAYAANARIVMGVLGARYQVFEPLPTKRIPAPADSGQTTSDPEAKQGDFEIKQGDIAAYGQRTSDGFVVFKDSKIKTTVAQTCPKSAIRQRERHAAKISPDGILQEDILFDSPSGAAYFVTGNSISGNVAWKTADGRTLKEVEASETAGLTEGGA